MTRMRIGLQMYTLRNEASTDFLGTLAKVAALGYEGVEFAGYGGLESSALKQELDRLGLICLGSHVSLERMLVATDEEIHYNKTLGNRNIIIPWLPEERYATADKLAETCQELAQIGEKCAKHGVILCYHNHSFELERSFNGVKMLDIIFSTLPANLVQVELDACWVHNAGIDPKSYIIKYAGRIPLVHLKDMQRIDGKGEPVELGNGEVDLLSVVQASREAGTEWLIVEQDRSQRPPLESVEISMNWIRKHKLIS
jgi:sugar phosphate isomerase/epimerase